MRQAAEDATFQRKLKLYGPEEYLALEETTDYKSEYYLSEIFAMVGGSVNHNRIAGNFYAVLNFAFASGPCDAFMNDMRLLVKQSGLYTYPDVMVACGQIDFVPNRTDTITNPILIVKVLSESTEGYDRGKKFEFYRAIPSFQHYLLIAQDRVHLEYFQKRADGRWTLQEFNDLGDSVKIELLEIELPLSRINNKVIFETPE